MPTTSAIRVGNILGAARAEADSAMLARAFVETPDYHAITRTDDFNFIVGRRGSGKSALFAKVAQHFSEVNAVTVVTTTPAEHDALEFRRLLDHCATSYKQLRAVARLVWKAHLLITTAKTLTKHYKRHRIDSGDFLFTYLSAHREIADLAGVAQCSTILKSIMDSGTSDPLEIPGRLAQLLSIERLKSALDEVLRKIDHSVILLYDGLDDGWEAATAPTAILGGLALAASDLVDARVPVRPLLFIRDNMFRALADLDSDFTRHIEGNTIRLHWDEASLFHLVAMRLRVALNLEEVEGDVKIWNRFAHRELKDKDGFNRCLHYTLYRPRDILVLLNDAYVNAVREGRDSIVEADVEASSRRISQTRLDDLLKEYEAVLPGLRHFVAAFKDSEAIQPFESATALLDSAAERADFTDTATRDFLLFGSGREIFFALYSVGFMGVFNAATRGYTFCHDGSASTLDAVESERAVAVHPCYWKALDLKSESTPQDVLVQINDDYDEGKWNDLKPMRTKRLGSIIEDLSRIDLGLSGHLAFEKWVFNAVKILFSEQLTNPELKPNPSNATQQRDVVCTNMAPNGFWRRIREDYGVRQVIFECKNYEELEPDDFRQVASYTSGEYGKLAVVITRATSELLSPHSKEWVKTIWLENRKLVFIVPAEILARCIRKLRNPNRLDYTEDTLSKRMDTFVRTYLSIQTGKKFRKKVRHKNRSIAKSGAA